MAERWQLKGDHIHSCICSAPCPCIFGQDPTKGYCQAVTWQDIAEGNYGSTDLSGRTIAMLFSWEGNFFSGDLTVGFLVDEGATDEQVTAFETILGGDAGGVFADLKGLYGTVKGIRRAPIRVDAGERPSAAVGSMRIEVDHLVGADESNPLVVTNSPFDFSGAGLKVGRTSGKFVDEEWGFDFDDLSYADTGSVDLSS